MELNEIKYGFKLQEIKELKDLDSTLYLFTHLKSGATLAHLANSDDNCWFAIGFRTLPEDDSGVCHIIEHSLLCGSEKFPLKEPFVNLLKTSLATFLNAMTAADWTMYPFASQTPQDFDNILAIYLDAVFNPLSVKNNKAFLQEGWHLELFAPQDKLKYNGVVYNEMKGAMASPEAILEQATSNALYRNGYRYNSGGDPEAITSLTYQDYCAYYHRHYTPQNALTYFYGKLDIEKKLQYLDENYFSHYTKSPEEITLEPDTPLVDLDYSSTYALGEGEKKKDNTYFSLAFSLMPYDNYEELLAFQALCDALLANNEAPLKKALLAAKLGQDVEYNLDSDNPHPALHIYLHKSNPQAKVAFREVFFKTCKQLCEEGIDPQLLLASLNQLEFKEREAFPKGLTLAMEMMGSFNYRTALDSHLSFSKHYAKLRQVVSEGYFEQLLQKYILASEHYVEVMLLPDEKLAGRKQAQEEAKLAAIKAQMSQAEIKALIAQSKELRAYQSKADSKKELKCLPQLKLRDLRKDVHYLRAYQVKVNGYRGIYHLLKNENLAYLRLYFDLKKVAAEDLVYVHLLKVLLLNVGTRKYSLPELNKQVKTYLGDFSFDKVIGGLTNEDCTARFRVGISALADNIGYIPDLLNEVLLHSTFTKKEVLLLLKQELNSLKQGIIDSNAAAAKMALRSYSQSAALTSQLEGVELYQALKALLKDFHFQKVQVKLKATARALFNKKNCLVSLNGSKATVLRLKEALKSFRLPRVSYPDLLKVTRKEKEAAALVVPSTVSYNALAASLESAEEKYNGHLAVLAHLVTFDHLWNNVRAKGGAYGCNLSFRRDNTMILTSFRDPNVKLSYETYYALADWLKNFKATKAEFLAYIIGTMSSFDPPLANALTIDLADLRCLFKITKQDRLKLKREILTTKPADINRYGYILAIILASANAYTIGNRQKIAEYPHFKRIDTLV